jgi:hypothetical protein
MVPCLVAAEVGGKGEVTGSFEMTELCIQGWVGSSDGSQEETSLGASQERRSVGASQDCCSATDCLDGTGADCHDGTGAASEESRAAVAEAGAMISAAR